MPETTIKLPRAVYPGIQAVVTDGKVNPYHALQSAKRAGELGFLLTERWILTNQHAYAIGAIKGFQLE